MSKCVQVKLPYYPELNLLQTETPFGSLKLLEQRCPYEEPLRSRAKNKKIVSVDKLVGMKDYWGDNILLFGRDNVYKLVSGDVEDDKELQGLLSTFYTTYSSFANYVDKLMIFGNQAVPFAKRFGDQNQYAVKDYHVRVESELKRFGSLKMLVENREICYYAVPMNYRLPTNIEGVKFIV